MSLHNYNLRNKNLYFYPFLLSVWYFFPHIVVFQKAFSIIKPFISSIMTQEYCLFLKTLLALFILVWFGSGFGFFWCLFVFGSFVFVLSSLSTENWLKFWRHLAFDACSLWVIFLPYWSHHVVNDIYSLFVSLSLSLRVVSLVLTQSFKVSSLLICYQPLFWLSLISYVIIDSCLFCVVLSCCNSCILALLNLLLWKSG